MDGASPKMKDSVDVSFDSNELSPRTKKRQEMASKMMKNFEQKSHMRKSHLMFGVKPMPNPNQSITSQKYLLNEQQSFDEVEMEMGSPEKDPSPLKPKGEIKVENEDENPKRRRKSKVKQEKPKEEPIQKQDTEKIKGKFHLMVKNAIMSEENEEFDPFSFHMKELQEIEQSALSGLAQYRNSLNHNSLRYFYDLLVISMDNPFLQVWKIVVVIGCILNSSIYAYFSAFGHPLLGSEIYANMMKFEVIFILDLIIPFFMEYQPENDDGASEQRIRDPIKIMKKNILTSSYVLNFLGVLPFELVIEQNHLKSIFKILRFFRGTIVLDQKYFLQFVKNFFNKRLQHLISVKADASYNIYQDNNKITLILYLRNIFKTVRLVLIILFASYFLGMFWYIYCDLTMQYIHDDTTDKFIEYFDILPEGA